MSGGSRYEEKVVTVLDNVEDVKWVVEKYRKKGWEATTYSRIIGPPASVKIKLRRKKATT